MKATDLMIGDWILVQDAPNAGFRPCKVTIGLLHNLLISNETKRSVMPLRLTPEILEKNGFKKQRELIEWTEREVYFIGGAYGDVNIVEYYYPDEKFTLCRIYYDYEEGTQVISFARIDYVHELQHALKLCSIEKEIIL